ncbi:MAG: hypothetical protein K8T10_06610 [Candidatus Eremiobacteraeota bacterium]|nr:hypothetical protein [Candidatus Eremiobacteraeota bacterium]
MEEKLDSTDQLLCALAYPAPLAIVAIILLVTKKENRTCRYHAFNALFAQIAGYILFIALGILGYILGHIPVLGCITGVIWGAITSIGGLAFFVYMIYLALETYKGNFPVIPYVTDFAKKYVEE